MEIVQPSNISVVDGGITFGAPATGYAPNEVVYVDVSGNLFGDTGFTRISTTKDFNVQQTQSGVTSGLGISTAVHGVVPGAAIYSDDGSTTSLVGIFDFGNPVYDTGLVHQNGIGDFASATLGEDVSGTNEFSVFIQNGTHAANLDMGDNGTNFGFQNDMAVFRRFSATSTGIGWGAGSTSFLLPETHGSNGQVITDNGSGGLFFSGPYPSGTGASGEIAYFDGTNSITSDGTLLWDFTNHYFFAGTGTLKTDYFFDVGFGSNAIRGQANGIQFGDLQDNNTGTQFTMDTPSSTINLFVSAALPGSGVITMGDYRNLGNETTFVLADNTKNLLATFDGTFYMKDTTGNSIFFNASNNNNFPFIQFGDTTGVGNHTSFGVSDGTGAIIAATNGQFKIVDNSSSNEIFTTAWNAGNPVILLGDITGTGNSTEFIVNDDFERIIGKVDGFFGLISTTSDIFFQASYGSGNPFIQFGDTGGFGNSTLFTLDDGGLIISAFADQINLNQNSAIAPFASIQLSNSAGLIQLSAGDPTIASTPVVSLTTAVFNASFSNSSNGTFFEVNDISQQIFIGGGLVLGYKEVTTNYAVTKADYTINCIANTFPVTLPDPSTTGNAVFVIKNSGSGIITVSGTSSNIDGSATVTLNPLDSITVQAGGAGNYIII